MTETVQLTYDLYALPTAQHRAGLAGLLVVLDVMRRTVGMEALPEIEQPEPGMVRFALAQADLQRVFDYLYTASFEEQSAIQQRKDRSGTPVEPLRVDLLDITDAKTGKVRQQKRYIYPAVVPGAPFLRGLGMPEPWLKLWREAVWSTLRGIPKTRGPYEERARHEKVSEVARLWSQLVRGQRSARDGGVYVTDVASSVYLGAQAQNAELVPFCGRPAENLLLHFWPVVMGVGEAYRIEVDKSTGKAEEKPAGFVLAIPDVVELGGFVDDFESSVDQLSAKMRGYRPQDAICALPAEGGLQYLHHLSAIAKHRLAGGALRFSLTGVDVTLIHKTGNTIPIIASERVPADHALLDAYEVQVKDCSDLTLRANLLRNLLDGVPWYSGLGRLFDAADARRFLGAGGGRFAAAVRRKFDLEDV
ncbi:MAG: type I-MYXAN CRISPR-associated protein Cmx8 [Dehalococcoidia bacterium]